MKPNVVYIHELPMESIRWPRALDWPKYQELVDSISQFGIRNPLAGWTVNGKIQVGPGKQRLHAARDAGLVVVPVVLCITDPVPMDFKSRPLHTPEMVEALYDDNYHVDMPGWRKGRLSIKKTTAWRDE
jgi:hypothetical protein